ncbi:hypothetical protein GGS24DRAFT_474022 [Hypoxylon argillaceum]|nr:hypothetical protein GGS24DRAFT_474022 [Hypoxylon argillaceum]KAI1152066.1 hypothetical protein F4825DRAFT_420556 [Nemania diffusa]
MCRGSRVEFVCGHEDVTFTERCDQKCSYPQDPLRHSSSHCESCAKEKRDARRAELMSRFMSPESTKEVQKLTERSHELIKRRFVEDTNERPTYLDSESDSDDGRRDTTYLTPDGNHVIEKQYQLINGDSTLITYRRELSEVDPALLILLRQKRERELAKEKRKEEKRKARQSSKMP